MIKTNFHIHTNFCDGKDSPEEIVLSAIEKNFDAIGFSSHAYTPYDDSYTMSISGEKEYINQIISLKEKYKDKIKIYLGVEKDYFSVCDERKYDYVIASVHAVLKNGKYLVVDESKEVFVKNVKEHYNSDYIEFAKDYFELVSKQDGNILGHIDLLTKFNENDNLFSTKDERYLEYAKKAVKILAEKNFIFEINTGAISRRYRTEPYPSLEILKMIKDEGGKILITGDSHSKDALDCGYDLALELAKKAGFTNFADIKDIVR